MKKIEYKIGIIPETSDIIEVYNDSGLNRPTTDSNRIAEMYANSNLVISAWSNNELIGIARSLTDFCYVCYLSDLAVKSEFQKAGIGKQLIALTRKEIGAKTTLLLLSAPIAMEYYPKIGFEKIDNAFIIHRTE